MKKRTEIIATIGPSSNKLSILREMIKEGVDIIRINSKYMPVKDYDKVKEKLKRIGKGKLMIDVKDRKIFQKIKGKKYGYIAVSFAEHAAETKEIKKMFPKTKIISKIETQKGVNNVNKLIKASDGIMIARGDLGRCISFEKVPMVQKIITKKCNRTGLMSITATEMMLSMVSAARPTRAEATDVANAILEGCEAVMLSEETAIGKHPVLVIECMVKIIKETEKYIKEFR